MSHCKVQNPSNEKQWTFSTDAASETDTFYDKSVFRMFRMQVTVK